MPTSYAQVYFPVLVQVAIALLLASGLIGMSFLLGKKVKDKVKESPYECGITPTGSARERFSVKYYLVGIVFILFDIEAIFLYPWANVYRELVHEAGMFPFVEMLLFIVVVLAGFFYVWKKGALDWTPQQYSRNQKTK